MYSQLSCKRPPLMHDKVVAYKRRSSTGRIKKISSNTWRYYRTSLKLNIQFRIDVTIHLSPYRVFHSRGQHLCKFTKGGVCIRKELKSHRICLGHQHGRRFIILGHQYGRRDVMWKHYRSYNSPSFLQVNFYNLSAHLVSAFKNVAELCDHDARVMVLL